MSDSKELLTDLKEKYEKSTKLIIEESKLDPQNEPYKSHYAARDILLELAQNIKNYVESANDESSPAEVIQNFKFILGHINVDLGRVYNFTEEVTTADKYLNETIESLSEFKLHPSAICAYLNALNENGILWMNRSDTEKAKEFLVNAETVYDAFKETKQTPLAIQDLFDICDKSGTKFGEKSLEKINCLTLFYLAQVFGSLGDLEKSAVYCHTTLKKQLNLGDFDSIDWALNAATLSQYFCTNNRFTEVSCLIKILFLNKCYL